MTDTPLSDAYRLDWQRVILNLRRAGLGMPKVAGLVGCKVETLKCLSRGQTKETLFSTSAGLLDLHERVCGPRHDVASLMVKARTVAPRGES